MSLSPEGIQRISGAGGTDFRSHRRPPIQANPRFAAGGAGRNSPLGDAVGKFGHGNSPFFTKAFP